MVVVSSTYRPNVLITLNELSDMRITRRGIIGATVGMALTTLAGCSGGGGGGGGGGGATATPTATPSPTPTPTEGSSGPLVQVKSHSDLGEILADSEGMTLYLYEEDPQGENQSTCSGSCAETWPALKVGDEAVTAGENVTADLSSFPLLATGGNKSHVTANGWPLYRYSKDEKPADAKGQGKDSHFALAPDGTPIKS